MVHVLASISVKPSEFNAFIPIFKANVPHVLAEKGCVEYTPAVHLDSILPAHEEAETTFTVIEKWESLDDLYAHFEAPHMKSFKEDTQDMVEGVSIQILQSA